MRRYSAHIGYLFSDRPLVERIAAARANGFDAVENPAPYATPAPVIAAALKEAGLTYVQMGLPSGDAARGEKGLAALPERVAEFRATLEPSLDYAEAVGCRAMHAMAGVRPEGVPAAKLWDTYIGNLALAADAARARGMLLLLEPIGSGTIADYLLDTPDLALRAIRELGRDNVRLIFDAFHTVNAGLDPLPFIRDHAGLIHHMHIADYPGRHEPGTGTLDFAALYAALDAAGYAGFIGCEYVPAGRTEDGLGWLAAHRAGAMRKAGAAHA
ncbi:hydroxypyruvate isomerase family protein [Ancylobacter mangrovi]|uniref:hydroxypyruvate isomerase family protein n=1 Tax=Ancylobacter mangrovi TaxID=2972472 RepID=UPI00216200A0|nr:TIM barrel protein [Ancylobacter mangrovi]MCS0500793.1 TIM barrel protein [Ancylobacter mangrovi]